MAENSQADQWSASIDNIHETTKWLITAFAAPAAIIVGTSPLIKFGTLVWYLQIAAAASGLVGIVVVLYAIKLASDILVMPPIYLSDVEKDAKLRELVDAHGQEILTGNTVTFDTFNAKRIEAIQNLSSATEADREKFQRRHEIYQRAAFRVLGLCNRERTRASFEATRTEFLKLAMVGVVAFGAFSWLTSLSHSEQGSDLHVSCAVPASGVSPAAKK